MYKLWLVLLLVTGVLNTCCIRLSDVYNDKYDKNLLARALEAELIKDQTIVSLWLKGTTKIIANCSFED